MLIDAFGRAITYLRISVTDRCNLRCAYCLPAGTTDWLPRQNLLSDGEIVRIVETGARLGLSKIRLTGGEPLVRPRLVELVQRLADIPGIQDISLTTNAMLLEKLALPLARAGLKRINISIDTLDAEKFKRMTRFGDLERVWRGIQAAEQAGLSPLKLNTVVVNGFNSDELPGLARLTLQHAWHVRFIEVMPIGNVQDWGAGFTGQGGRYISTQAMRAQLAFLDLQPETSPTGSGPARTFRIPGAPGTVGFISPLGEHFCEACNRLRLTADGRLRSCLVVPNEVSLRDALQTFQPLEPLFQQAVALKPRQHDMREATSPIRGAA